MNEMLQGKLSEILELEKNGVLKVADMIKEQMPDLVEQILKYNFILSLILFIIGIGCFVVVYKCGKKIVKVLKYESEREDSCMKDQSVITNMVCGALIFICLIVGSIFIFDYAGWIKILFTPKLYLVEYLSRLIK